jgi:hypothetical protein
MFFPIASAEQGLIISDLTAGKLYNVNVRPIDSNDASNRTRFNVSFLPMSAIPSMSSIVVKFPPTIQLPSGNCSLQFYSPPFSPYTLCKVDGNSILLSYPFGTAASYMRSFNAQPLWFVINSYGVNPANANDVGPFTMYTAKLDPINNGMYTIDQAIQTMGVY